MRDLSLVPERWLLPPPPQEPELRRRWDALPFAERRRIAAAATHDGGGVGPEDAALVAAVARARLASGWRLYAVAVGVGWLVLMLVWGFGRSGAPAAAHWFALAGSVAGVFTTAVLARDARDRLRRARSRSRVGRTG